MKSYFIKGTLSLLAIFSFGYFRVSGQCNELYGVTFEGGEFNGGTIFKTDGNGDNFSTAFSFFQYEGFPISMYKSDNGKQYGLSPHGFIFEFDPASNAYIKKFKFLSKELGISPVGNLVEGNNGKLYGLTLAGGIHDGGVIFEWDPATNLYVKKYDFAPDNAPFTSLMKAGNGKFYGTAGGGLYSAGTLFKWDPDSNIYQIIVDFNSNNGSLPWSPLMQAETGKIYGTTYYGGTKGMGVLFELDPETDSLIKLVDFNGAEKGQYPKGSLIEANNGKIYGTTVHGGIYGHSEGEQGFLYNGVLFSWDPETNTYSKILDFDGINNGRYPEGGLKEGCTGKLYGSVGSGGKNDHGILFEVDPAVDCFTKKADFDSLTNAGELNLMENCKFQGIFSMDEGKLKGFFEWDPESDSLKIKQIFLQAEMGAGPVGQLVLAGNGKYYGMTNYGGLYYAGVLYEWDPASDIYSKKLDFRDTLTGGYPEGSLVKANNGKLYGMTRLGGRHNWGVLFEWDPATGIYSKKIEFNGADSGGLPSGSLIQAYNGKLYGMTNTGGEPDEWGHRYGLVFEWDPVTGIITKKIDFNGPGNGSSPNHSLVQASNGKLYGTTINGGKYNSGVLFELDPSTGDYDKKIDFNTDTTGGFPLGSLIQADNGMLYGLTQNGGLNLGGLIFEYDPVNNSVTKKIDLSKEKYGAKPLGSLVQAFNGMIYGLISDNSNGYGYGAMFEWDPKTSIYTEKQDSVYGIYPFFFDGLSKSNYSTSDTISAEASGAFVSPSGRYTWTVSGFYKDTIPNAAGCDSVITVDLTINNITGLEANTFKSRIILYPNPADGQFTIDLGKVYPDAEITITQLDGRIIKKEYIVNSRYLELQLSESRGLYLVSVNSGDERAVFKLSKK